jgi:cold-inducible RNA-binding protein
MKNIFVGNLSFGATESSVRSLFEAYGAVDRVSIVTDRDTGQARGFGFVEMSNNTEADRAINELNGRDLDGRALNVNEARPKTDRAAGGGGGGQRRNNRWSEFSPEGKASDGKLPRRLFVWCLFA